MATVTKLFPENVIGERERANLTVVRNVKRRDFASVRRPTAHALTHWLAHTNTRETLPSRYSLKFRRLTAHALKLRENAFYHS